MHSFDDRYLKEAERRERLASRVADDATLAHELSAISARWQAEEKERQLIIAARRGDKDAFAGLFQRYWEKLWALCSNLVGQAEASDMAQEAIIKAWDKLQAFDTRHHARFDYWLFSIARHLCLSRLRQLKRVVKLSLDEAEPDGRTLKDMLPQAEVLELSASLTLRVEIKQLRQRCWPLLSEEERFTLNFIFFEERAFKELGLMLGAKEGQSAHNTGKYHVRKALKKLADCLQAEGLEMTPSQLLQMLDEQESEGGDMA
jgi:RNA polymerase sigma factor (sigma-70 family)